MKLSQLALAAAMLAALSAGAFAQEYGYPMGAGGFAGGPQGMGYGPGAMQAMGPQMGYYPGAMPGQQMGGQPMMMPMPGQMPGQMSYPAMQAGYPMMGQMGQSEAQQALYGPATPMNGDPLPMNDGNAGSGPGCGCGPNQAECFDDHITHYAYGSAEVFYARRDNNVIRQPVVIDTTTGGVVASTSDTEFRYLPGIKAQAGYMFGSGFGVETDFWGQWAFASRKNFGGNANLAIPGDLGLSSLNFFDVDQIDLTYASHINNYEINFILPYASVQYLAGFRYLTVDERYDISTFSATTGSGDYQILTRNRMYGGQLGARTQWQIERFIFDFEGRAGVFANAAHQDQTVVDASGFQLRNASGSEREPAFVGEVSSYLFIPMGTHFTGRLGYTAIWIEDLALAPDQLDFSNTATSGTGVYARHGMLIHGFNAGLEARW
jgi:Putative beta barrel porin-7 (BBP7)